MFETAKGMIQSRLGKVVWTIAAISITLARLPFWLVYYSPQNLRQHPKWTYLQAIMHRVLRILLYHSALMEVQLPLLWEPEIQKDRFANIEPARKDIYQGVLADSNIKPATTGGWWFPSPYSAKVDEEMRIVLYFHGGAFVVGEGRADARFAATTLAVNLKAKVFSLSYRLSSTPTCQFPAALQDAVTAYQYLVDLRTDAKQIIIAGDSAGGNLAIALLRYIEDNKGILPTPLAAVICSPWLDLASALETTNVDQHASNVTDYLVGNFTVWGAKAYAPAPMRVDNPYISPLNHPFFTHAQLWICVGGLEILCADGVRFAENMKKVKGNKVEVHIEPYASHAFLYVGNLTGFESEAKHAIKSANEWILETHV
ncbi:hypothetical protein JMJ35_003634 [Cladonia borealis]|uniref:Alpha/beta hydrolase fold-3 domain-containing protein n=1 Tax=Cladonia borealis TaxID=184061 RepID=A0AA39V306_9LECA|nr:hypothetical protein JMJ35_003634 [Cladonia borealis]